jgi:hypothetical protein
MGSGRGVEFLTMRISVTDALVGASTLDDGLQRVIDVAEFVEW